MRTVVLCLSGLCLAAGSAGAVDQKALNSLRKLDPGERLEQRCDIEAMERIAKDESNYRPDKVIAYTFSDPETLANGMRAKGAAFRSKGAWYRLQFSCQTGPEHMSILAFDYRVGEAVPRSQWQEHYLTD